MRIYASVFLIPLVTSCPKEGNDSCDKTCTTVEMDVVWFCSGDRPYRASSLADLSNIVYHLLFRFKISDVRPYRQICDLWPMSLLVLHIPHPHLGHMHLRSSSTHWSNAAVKRHSTNQNIQRTFHDQMLGFQNRLHKFSQGR